MTRMIDAEKYMELLKEQYLHHKSVGNSQAAKAWQGAMQLLYDMPTLTPPNEWVSVEEKLPETGDRYIVLIKQKYPWEKEWEFNVDVACYTFDDGYIDNCWDTFVDWLEGQETHVTHWMPLPAPPNRRPPKGEKNDD